MSSRVICIAFFSFFLFSSFTVIDNKTALPAGKNLETTTADVRHIDRTFVEDITFVLCNGDMVYVPELTTHLEILRVQNGNTYMEDGKVTQTGVGQSVYTGEVYTINLEDKYHNKEPFNKGAEVYNQKSVGTITNAVGNKDNYYINSHVTRNANGELASFDYELTTECQ